MKTRVLVGILLLAAMGGLFAVDWLLDSRAAVSSLIVLAALWGWVEFAVIGGVASSASGGGLPLFLAGTAGTAWFLALAWVGAESGLLVASGVLGTVLATSAAAVVRKDHRGAFLPFLVSLLGVFSCGLALSYLLRIYRNPDGILLGIVFLLGIKGNDIVAYFVGSTLGRVRFLTVSPKKSLEGFLAAWIFGAVWFGGVAWLWPDRFFAWPLGAALGIILSLASQVGDLTESLLKRFHGVKDSSVLLPEFGGVLDLVDSFLYCGFLFWICLGG